MLRAGKPAVTVVTEVFANLALAAATARGVEPLPLLILPHPMEHRPAFEIDAIAAEKFEAAIAALTQPVPPVAAARR